jgi:hypothetical protein
LFAVFVKKFKRFEVHTTKRTTNFKIFNLELKLAGLIFNIEKFVNDNKSLFQDYIESSKCVFDINWDFENIPLVFTSENVLEYTSNLRTAKERQLRFLEEEDQEENQQEESQQEINRNEENTNTSIINREEEENNDNREENSNQEDDSNNSNDPNNSNREDEENNSNREDDSNSNREDEENNSNREDNSNSNREDEENNSNREDEENTNSKEILKKKKRVKRRLFIKNKKRKTIDNGDASKSSQKAISRTGRIIKRIDKFSPSKY